VVIGEATVHGNDEDGTLGTHGMLLSADDLLQIPVPPHLRGYELADGELVAVMAASAVHGRLIGEITGRIRDYLSARPLGQVYVDVGFVLGLPQDPERMRGPDISFISESTLREHGGEPERGWFRFAPDLVVEIDSPGRKPRIEQQRIQDYIEAGVRLLWIVHCENRSATIYRADGTARLLREKDALEGEAVLPDFRLPLTELFRKRTMP
jgi:Uma2 family endonuclease